jgi:ATP adenylyltransferase
VTDSHFVIANKFCFARPHLMLLTCDGHRRQYEPLDEADLDGVWRILSAAETDYVAFYNCGRDGGCSRLHKHLQVMPLPVNSFAAFLDSSEGEEPETKVPFEWFFRRFEGEVTSAALVGVYNDLLEEATQVGGGRGEHAASAPSGAVCPHNMILTKRWMVVLPRRRGAINREAGVNSLGMLGVIAVATTKEIDNWVRLGLTESLAELGVPKGV